MGLPLWSMRAWPAATWPPVGRAWAAGSGGPAAQAPPVSTALISSVLAVRVEARLPRAEVFSATATKPPVASLHTRRYMRLSDPGPLFMAVPRQKVGACHMAAPDQEGKRRKERGEGIRSS